MGHTNSTTNYNLPQFVTTDKPAWLTDINGAFSAIDSAIHTAQSDATTAGTNASQALLDASAASTAASTADAKGAGALASIADSFDATSTYLVGDMVMYNSLLYTCTTAVTTPGPWTGITNWTRTTVESSIPSNASQLPLDSSGTPSTAAAIASKLSSSTFNNLLNFASGSYGVRFETYSTRLLIWVYTNEEHTKALRIDFNGTTCTFGIIDNGTLAVIATFTGVAG